MGAVAAPGRHGRRRTGLHVVSADGLPHTLRILVPGQSGAGTMNRTVSLIGGTDADSQAGEDPR